IVAVSPQLAKLFGLALPDRRIELEKFDWFIRRLELVDADDDALLLLDFALVPVGSFLDLLLLEALFERSEGAAHVVDGLDVLAGFVLEAIGQVFDEVGATERVDDVGDAVFVGDDLLRAERDLYGLLGG